MKKQKEINELKQNKNKYESYIDTESIKVYNETIKEIQNENKEDKMKCQKLIEPILNNKYKRQTINYDMNKLILQIEKYIGSRQYTIDLNRIELDTLQQQRHQIDKQIQTLKSIFDYSKGFGPSLILPNIYLGGIEDCLDKAKLQELGIKKIINVAGEIDNYYPNLFEYHKFPCKDDPEEDISSLFIQVFDILKEASESATGVLVHCYAGISRSSTIIIAYLMQLYQWSMEQSLDYVRQKRSIIEPNDGFIKQLDSFAKGLFLTNKKNIESKC